MLPRYLCPRTPNGLTMTEPRSSADDLRAASKLAVSATDAVTEAVEAIHRAILSGPAVLGAPLSPVAKLFTSAAYGHIRRITRVVGLGVDTALSQLAPLLGDYAPGFARDAAVAALNGVAGDRLADSGNPLAIQPRLRRDGKTFTCDDLDKVPDLGPRPLVLVHGSSMSDRQWRRNGHDHGAALARDLGYTPLYLHYNSGLHVSTNGRALATLLEQLVAAWPVPIDSLALIGHSMGGLVARSACHIAELEEHAWRAQLGKLVCLGTPHHGAPLERGGSWLEALFGTSHFSAPLAKLAQVRSAGVTDLRYGLVLDEHWQGRDRFARAADPRSSLALPTGVACYALAGTIASAARATAPADATRQAPPPTRTADGETTRLPGDGMVPVQSALGHHPTFDLGFPAAHQHIAFGTNHLGLLEGGVYDVLRDWMG